MTKCGHSFCHDCIKKSLERNNRCPRWQTPIASPSDVFPNFTLTELIRKHRLDEQKSLLDKQLSVNELRFLSQDWDLGDINNVMYLLGQRKQHLEQGSKVAETRMLKCFLEDVKMRREKELEKVKRQLEVLTQDCKVVGETLREYEEKEMSCPDHMVPNVLGSLLGAGPSGRSGDGASSSSGTHSSADTETPTTSSAVSESFAGSSVTRPSFEMTEVRKKRKLSQHFEDLESVYLSTRQMSGAAEEEGSLDQFATCLAKFSQYTDIR